MKVDLSQAEDAKEFIEQALSLRLPVGSTWIASRYDSGKLGGVIAFHPVWNANSLMHTAANSTFWLTPDLCQAMRHHLFQTLAAQRGTATIYESNTRSVRIVRRLGFQLEGISPGFSGGTMLLFGLLKGEKNGRTC